MKTLRRLAVTAASLVTWPALAQQPTTLEDIVISATGRPEPRSQIAGTVQVIGQEKIASSTAKSVTDLLAENAVGFLSEWTPAQTSLNIRGASTEGQGRDFRSQVLILLNGHRAGTANLSKLSLADVERIEIVRGPSSVVYGSQNMGGVVNIILKTGRTAPGVLTEFGGGSWGLVQGKAQMGGINGPADWYVGIAGGRRSDYHAGAGGGTEVNSAWKRGSATGAFGYQFNELNRIDMTIRTDGIYDAGFRGSGANVFNLDNRFNHSFDVSYTGRLPNGVLAWYVQTYLVRDVDHLVWASPVIRNATTGLPALGTSADHNKRQLDIIGNRFQPRLRPWEGNELLVGWDWERSQLRSDRFRVGVPGNPLAQVSPMDNNQTEDVHAFYAEDSQRFFGDRLTVRGGVRQTYGTTSFDPTPFLPGQVNRSADYQAMTYSVGASFKALEWLTARVGASSGFRAPTATELAADFNALGGGRIFGNPGLKPESSDQIEAGFTIAAGPWRLDTAVFENKIHDRIITQLRPGVAATSDWVNNPGDIVVRGVEVQFDADVLRTFGVAAGPWRWTAFANGYYNFHMADEGAPATANTNRPQRIYEYQAAVGTRFGQTGGPWKDWSLQFAGILRGPMWYDTEEALLIPQGEPFSTFIHRKDPFWVFNARGEIEIAKGIKLFAAVNNIFDVNEHPIFIALDVKPCIADPRFQNGGCGTSMPGREFVAGVQGKF